MPTETDQDQSTEQELAGLALLALETDVNDAREKQRIRAEVTRLTGDTAITVPGRPDLTDDDGRVIHDTTTYQTDAPPDPNAPQPAADPNAKTTPAGAGPVSTEASTVSRQQLEADGAARDDNGNLLDQGDAIAAQHGEGLPASGDKTPPTK